MGAGRGPAPPSSKPALRGRRHIGALRNELRRAWQENGDAGASCTGCAPIAPTAPRRRAGRTPCRSAASRSGRSACCVAGSWFPRPRWRRRRSRRRRRRSTPPRRRTPTRCPSRGQERLEFAALGTGKVSTTNTVSAMILTITSTALNRAFPGADDQQAGDQQRMTIAGRLMRPPCRPRPRRRRQAGESRRRALRAGRWNSPTSRPRPRTRRSHIRGSAPSRPSRRSVRRSRLGVGVGGARRPAPSRRLGVAERGQGADEAGDDEAIIMPGPAFCAASAVSTKMPVPITAPMPSRVSWNAPSERLSDFFSAVARIASSDLIRPTSALPRCDALRDITPLQSCGATLAAAGRGQSLFELRSG